MTTRIGIFLFEGAEELDWAGPWEVLSFWARMWPDDDVEVFTVSRDGDPVTCAKGLRVLVDHSWSSAPPIDVLVYPGGQGTRPQVGDEDIRKWVRSVADDAQLMTSVCTGALVYADSGLLKNRPAATYWASFDELIAIDPSITPQKEARFVDDGDVITAAGVSAGIDMALHLVDRL
ncbi:MAG TPA: DJ-1/PfpI family protein, partial [Actinomycetota bacterium]|nr:DJ-1/PfpI family protein [Actinomycetota bacterium]